MCFLLEVTTVAAAAATTRSGSSINSKPRGVKLDDSMVIEEGRGGEWHSSDPQ
jgi:hypothetical protein